MKTPKLLPITDRVEKIDEILSQITNEEELLAIYNRWRTRLTVLRTQRDVSAMIRLKIGDKVKAASDSRQIVGTIEEIRKTCVIVKEENKDARWRVHAGQLTKL